MEKRMILKSMFIWLGIIPLAILNGALRIYVLTPIFGATGFLLSGLLLGGMIFLMLYIFIPRLERGPSSVYMKIGILWVLCTLLFETFLGLITGETLSEIINAYNIFSGNLWLLVVIFIGFAPWLAAKMRKLI